MKEINYPGVDPTGMDRATFEKTLEECERRARTKSTDYFLALDEKRWMLIFR